MEIPMTIDFSKVDQIVQKYEHNASKVILMLQDIQTEFRYIPQEAVTRLSENLRISESQIFHIATFYKAFSLTPRGEHEVRVCLGTACHIRGGKRISDGFERSLNLKAGETTPDAKFTLETVNCLGACALAPLVQVDEENYGKMTIEKIETVLKQYRK